MCGFVVWADRFQKIDQHYLIKLRDLLSHRGPDDSGLLMTSNFHIGLGFRRLSIIDLSSAGNQPMSNEDGSTWIVFNGEVYNFAEIRQDLEKSGHLFRSRTDTEVILHAYEEWGEECVQKFIGMFAFVIWDDRKKRLIAFRDRLGIKPLYYSVTAHGIILASELKPIIAVPGFRNELDPEALHHYLARGYISSPHTIFQSAKSLSPGHILSWSQASGQITLTKYWEPLDYFLTAGQSKSYSENEMIEGLEDLLRSSVKYRLISDVPLGVFLSAGLDSTLVTALMCQVSNSEVRTFTIGYKEDKYNESSYAEKIAQYLGTVHTTLQANYKDAQKLIHRLPDYYDEPFADSSQIPTLLVSKLARQHVTVALSGDGGDELFSGYETYRLMENWQHLWKFPQSVRAMVGHVAALFPNERLKLALLGLALPNPVAFASYFSGFWRPQEIEALLPDIKPISDQYAGYSGLTYVGNKSHQATLIEKLMLIDLKRYLPGDILTKVDRASMAVSLEARVPLLDHRLVEYALNMPLSLKRRDGESKFALRKILYKYVPSELVDRPKQGFGIPLDDWLKTDLRGLLERYLDPILLQRQGLFDAEVVRHHVNRFLGGYSGHSRVWSLLMFQMWTERYMGLEV